MYMHKNVTVNIKIDSKYFMCAQQPSLPENRTNPQPQIQMEALRWSLPSLSALSAALLVSRNEAVAILFGPSMSGGFIRCLACSSRTARAHRRLHVMTSRTVFVERRCSMPIRHSSSDEPSSPSPE
mmetsp:Transcript_7184/g.11974  ORF Transcript_7184/g.11974 Transcript_7184/m.11974 type:complete len:126 (-) Transcript_7184:275-652(-)